MAGSITRQLLLLGALASEALASCAYGTLLHPRAEGGAVEVNKFGYTGKIVCRRSHSDNSYLEDES
jgi:hypothetical protein